MEQKTEVQKMNHDDTVNEILMSRDSWVQMPQKYKDVFNLRNCNNDAFATNPIRFVIQPQHMKEILAVILDS